MHPVITADRGGMAELVTDEVSGLLFRHRDWKSLHAVIDRICERPEIVSDLRKGIPPVPLLHEHVRTLLGLYEEFLGRANGPAEPIGSPHTSHEG